MKRWIFQKNKDGVYTFSGACRLWRFEFDLLINPTTEQFHKHCQQYKDYHGDPHDLSGCDACVCEIGGGGFKDHVFVIYMSDWPKDYQKIGSLSHELLHVAFRLLIGRGLDMVRTDEESLCYLHEWMLSEILEAYAIHKKRKRKKRKS